MRITFCALGWVFALAAGAAAGWAAALGGLEGVLKLPLGELWFKLHTGSLNLLQAVIERYLWPPLWDSGVAPLLHLPGVLALAVPAALFLSLCLLLRLRRL